MRIQPTAAAFVAIASVLLSAAPAAAECVFAKLGDMAVDMTHGQPRVQIEANGQKRWVLLVTGSHSSALRKVDAAALGGTTVSQANAIRMTAKGEQRLNYTRLREVVIGGTFSLKDFEVFIDERKDTMPDDIAGYLGSDILAASDVEFDLVNSRITFFTPKGCDRSNLGYWGGTISEAPMVNVVATNQPIALANIAFRPRVTLNGRPVTAELNSSYSFSVVDQGLAGRLGLKPDAAGVSAAQTTGSIAKFSEFAIGDEKINNPSFVLRELYRGADINQTGSLLRSRLDGLPEMILGLDFMRSHRILVANSQQKMYFSYNGGPVFRTLPMKP